MAMKMQPEKELGIEEQAEETETYLLTNKGLEKLDIEKEINVNPEGNTNDPNAIKEKSDDDKDMSRSQLRTNYDAKELSRMVNFFFYRDFFFF